MPRRLIARLVGTGLRAVGGALSGAGTVVLKLASTPDRDKPRRPDPSGTTPPR